MFCAISVVELQEQLVLLCFCSDLQRLGCVVVGQSPEAAVGQLPQLSGRPERQRPAVHVARGGPAGCEPQPHLPDRRDPDSDVGAAPPTAAPKSRGVGHLRC